MARLTEDIFSRGLETARILLASPRFSTTLAAAIRRRGGVDRAIDALLKEFELETSETPSQQTAREIMGSNMLGTLEVERYFGELTDEQREALEIIPFSEETLKACTKTHILVADVGLSLLDVRQKARKGLFYSQNWFDNEEFAGRTETACWRLIRKIPVDGSFSKDWSEQNALVDSKIDEIPSARQVVYTTILHFLATGERLFEKVYVRTSDVDSDGNRVSVGDFGVGGLRVGYWLDGRRYGSVGVSSSRKAL